MERDGTELSEAIAAVRAGLEQARQSGTHSTVRFVPQEVVLDFTVELRRTGQAKGAVKAYVVSVEAGADSARATTQHVSIRLRVTDAAGRELPVGDQLNADQLRRADGG